MSNPVATEKTNVSARREKIRVRVESLRRSPKLGMLGLPEMAALGISLVLLLVVLFTYFYLFAPARTRHDRAQEQRDTLQKQMRDKTAGIKNISDTQATVADISKSLQDFEDSRLPPGGEGRMSIYQELNELIRRNGLRATGGINYSALDPLGTPREQQGTGTFANVTRSGSSKYQSVYPGLSVSLTVEGPYANLRRFVRDIESSRQFIIVNSVELEGGNEARAVSALPGEATNARAASVSLRLDMAAYFRRDASTTGTEQQTDAR